MGLNANLAIMMSGIATICFLLIVQGKVPSYLGTSASLRRRRRPRSTPTRAATVRAARRTSPARSWSPASCSRWSAWSIHYFGPGTVNKVLPPVVTGAVVMLIGFNLAPVATKTYMPSDPWVAIITMTAVILMAVGLRGFFGRIAVFLGLIFGYLLSVLFDAIFGKTSLPLPGNPEPGAHDRVNWDLVKDADWFGFPSQTKDGLVGNQAFTPGYADVGWHLPSFSITFILLALPAVIALVAENIGHVKAVAEMTKTDLDPVLGRAVAADGVGTVITSAVGGSPTTTYAENIGVMAATRVYSTAAYFVAAFVAILLGPGPEVRADRQRDPARGPGRHHARPLRDDRPARRQDLEGERGRLRQARSTSSRSRPASSSRSATPSLKITDDFILTRHRPRYARDRARLPPRARRRAQGGRRRAPCSRSGSRASTRSRETSTLRLSPARVRHRSGGGPGR